MIAKNVYRTAFTHFFCACMFALLYYMNIQHFKHIQDETKANIIDCFMTACSIQASVGMINFYPITNTSKILVTTQTIMVIFIHVLTLYVFATLLFKRHHK